MALFYRTLHGSEVGDLFTSLIHTCELTATNPFDYLIELQRHAHELADNPSAWMSWNYLEQTQPGQNQYITVMLDRTPRMAAKRASHKADSNRVFGRSQNRQKRLVPARYWQHGTPCHRR